MSTEHKIDCYWDAADREFGRSGICEILDDYDDGTVVAVESVAVVKVTFCARLEPAADAETDDYWTVEADTREAAEAAVDAEMSRRKGIAQC
jgi:hypothetical protein